MTGPTPEPPRAAGPGRARRRAGRVRTAVRRFDPRTRLASVDPGLVRLRLAAIAVASMLTAVGITALLRSTVASGEPVTVVLFAGALAMISNLAVNEPDPVRLRVTTALMALPAAAATVAGTLLAPHRIPAAIVFVLVMMAAVWVRRYGPRGFALGMAAFMPYFFTQFLIGASAATGQAAGASAATGQAAGASAATGQAAGASAATGQAAGASAATGEVAAASAAASALLPWLLVAVVTGLSSTLLLRGLVFAERPERTLRRLLVAFRARAWVTVRAVDDLLAAVDDGGPDERALVRARRARRRLNATALLVEEQLEQTVAGRVWPGLDDDMLALRVFDAELALERLAVAVQRLVRPPDGSSGPGPAERGQVTALRVALSRLGVALRTGTDHDAVIDATADARGAVAGLVAAGADPDVSPPRDRARRAAFAVHRVADAVHHAQLDAPAGAALRRRSRARRDGRPEAATGPAPAAGTDTRVGAPASDGPRPDGPRPDGPGPGPDDPGLEAAAPRGADEGGLALSTRQAVQVGVGTSIAIVVGELVAPSRWYWAVIAAFVVFAGTQSRGDLLGRGWGRMVGTALGVAAGMALAALVGGATVPSLVLLFVCVFLGLYLVRISPGLLAFWITAVLALVYGLIGQFSVDVLVLRIEETVIGALASILAAFLVLPRRTRAAFGEAVDDLVDVTDDVLGLAVDRLAGGRAPVSARARAREMDTALDTVRQRARPLRRPAALRRVRTGRRGDVRVVVRVLVICDHYTRALARLSDTVSDPGWRRTLVPAADLVRANLGALRDLLVGGGPLARGDRIAVASAEALVDAAESYAAARDDEPASGVGSRRDMLTAARLLRRIDQAVVALAGDLGADTGPDPDDDTGPDADAGPDAQSPSTEASAGLTNTRSGS